MLETIKIVKDNNQNWKLVFNKKEYYIGDKDSSIMDLLKPSNNQSCAITDLTSDNAVCYFLLEGGKFKVYSFPDNVLRITTSSNLQFFSKLEEGVKYYLIPMP